MLPLPFAPDLGLTAFLYRCLHHVLCLELPSHSGHRPAHPTSPPHPHPHPIPHPQTPCYYYYCTHRKKNRQETAHLHAHTHFTRTLHFLLFIFTTYRRKTSLSCIAAPPHTLYAHTTTPHRKRRHYLLPSPHPVFPLCIGAGNMGVLKMGSNVSFNFIFFPFPSHLLVLVVYPCPTLPLPTVWWFVCSVLRLQFGF